MYKHVCGFLLSLIVLFAPLAHSATMYGYLKNETPREAQVTLTNDGPVFGGGSSGTTFKVASGATGSGSLNATDGIRLEPYISSFSIGGGSAWSTYYCFRWSTVSLADASSKPCDSSNTFKTGAYTSSPSLLHATVMYAVLTEVPAPGCSATTLGWGASNFCTATVPATSTGGALSLTNSSAVATGSASASCTASGWSVSSPVCSASLETQIGLFATDAANASSININWGAASGASTYRLQQRKQGAATWTDLTVSAGTSYNWTGLSDDSIFEFQVRAENAVGVSDWSPVETGSIRPVLGPLFVSQSGIPSKIGVGQSFTFQQVWKNVGSETWTGTMYGTGHFAADGAIQWNVPFTPFAGTTSLNAQVTSSMTATAPSVAGTYTLQRIMQKNGTGYGSPSTKVAVVVYGIPTCSSIATDVETTFNANGSITASLVGDDSVESATLRAWGDIQGEGNGVDYPMSFNGAKWVATFPVATHLSEGEAKINLNASVANSVFSSSVCATSSVAYQQLPMPIVTLTPTFGTFGDASKPGFVVNRATGDFATITVDLGAFAGKLKAYVELLPSRSMLMPALNGVTSGQPSKLSIATNVLLNRPAAWQAWDATVRVAYADPAAASQRKEVLLPIQWASAPGGLVVTASGIKAMSPAVQAKLSQNAGPFDAAVSGAFTGSVRIASSSTAVGSTQEVDADGVWNVNSLDYSQLYATPLVAVARAIPPGGFNLLNPLEFISPAFTLPVQSPPTVAATDGTRENDVRIEWPPVATGSSIRYRLFRDSLELTPVTGISGIEFIDLPPTRGTTYTYTVKTMINNVVSQSEASDTGFVPACRAARLIGASLNADMSAINGLIERWECLEDATGSGAVDAGTASAVPITGSATYRSFSYVLDPALADGAHVLRLGIESKGVVINATRSYDIPFTLGRSSISLKSLTILYDGSTAQPGLEATSIGRFGARMEGGTGLGFAEEIK